MAQKKKIAGKSGINWSRRKKLLIPIAILLPLMAVLAVVVFSTKREPLTAKEILEKQEWTRGELEDTLARSFQLKSDRENRHEVMQHLRRQMESYTPDDRRQIQAAALVSALNMNLEQFRLLDEADRRKILDRMNDQANRNAEKVRQMNSAERNRMREQLASEEGKSVMNEINRIMAGRMTPEERSEFMPLTRKWLDSMQGR